MTKAELIDRMMDYMIDEGRDCPEDFLDLDPIDLDYAKVMVKDFHTFEDECDLEEDERIAHLITPELMMEVYNCLLRAKKFEARVERLADWIKDNDPVCEYCNYYLPAHEDAIDICPVDFVWEKFPFDLVDDMLPNPLVLIRIGMNSRKTFDFDDEYCWFDKDALQLHSTNRPFEDGVLDAEAFAKFILLDAECFGYMFDDIMTNEEAEYILGCAKEEYIHE